jgi:phosphoribosyl 1,2-cyclic phosphodiesterase
LATTDFQVSFWGVRGSLPVPGPATVKFGGNTSCVQVQVGERLIILDAGTGIYKLGQHLIGQSSAINGEIFITHTIGIIFRVFLFLLRLLLKGTISYYMVPAR